VISGGGLRPWSDQSSVISDQFFGGGGLDGVVWFRPDNGFLFRRWGAPVDLFRSSVMWVISEVISNFESQISKMPICANRSCPLMTDE